MKRTWRTWKPFPCLPLLVLTGGLAMTPSAVSQSRPYIGFVYPAGGQQGTTFQVRIGGQGLDDVDKVVISGTGVKARVIDYQRRLSPQDITLLREQLTELRKASRQAPRAKSAATDATRPLQEKLEKRIAEYVNRPACASIANLVFIEVTVSRDAKPGEREIRLGTLQGVSNPMVFHVGQLPEFTRPAMSTCEVQVLGKEELALRRNSADERELRIELPCTVNGQTASGEVDRYRFHARKGQQLVIITQARQLIPYIADAVPGWFQPVLRLLDSGGREVAYVDDFRFKPDPVIAYQAPADGEYIFTINDSIYRGREDFVYRITVGEVPFVTSIFPLGARAGDPLAVQMRGWNLGNAELTPPPKNAAPGIHLLAAVKGDFALNRIPFAVDELPECSEREPDDAPATAQRVGFPILINGRVNRPDDWDVFEFTGRARQTIVAEVMARRLDSPLDSILKLTDANGNVLAFSDDREDLGSGVNTHHADSYLVASLPADGAYRVHLGDTARSGGEEFAYRLRISPPQPDFALRVVPSSVALRSKSSANVSVHVIRKDGFTGPIQVKLKNPPWGLSSSTVSLAGTQQVAQLTLKTGWLATREPLNIAVVGSARIEGRDVTREAVPAEDRMQAFLWRHLVPAAELKVSVYNPSFKPPPKRVPVSSTAIAAKSKAATAAPASGTQTFTKRQVAGRLRDLKLLFEEGLLTSEFYLVKVAECEAAR